MTDNKLQVQPVAIRKTVGPNRNASRLVGDWTVRRYDAPGPPVGPQKIRVREENTRSDLPTVTQRLIGRSVACARFGICSGPIAR